MKSALKYLLTIVSALVSLQAVADPNQLVTQGRAALAIQDLATANARFQQALAEDPNHPVANFYYAAARIAMVSKQPAADQLFDRLGLTSTGRNIYAWEARLMTNAQGQAQIPSNVSAAELFTFVHDQLLPQVIGAGTNLAKITNAAFLQNVTYDDVQIGEAGVDYSDVLTLRSMLHAMEVCLYSIASWNMDVQLTSLRDLIQRNTTLERLLGDYPNLLTTGSSADLPAARASFTAAINEYSQASAGLRARPGGTVRLFNLETNRLDGEFHFRTMLEDLRASLNGPVQLRGNTNVTVHAAKFFEAVKSPRQFLPRVTENTWVAGTIPDSTFGGVVQGFPLFKLEELLEEKAEPASHFSRLTVLPNGSVEVALSSAIWEPIAVDVSTNLIDWIPVFETNDVKINVYATFTNRHVFVDNIAPGAKRFYRAVSNPTRVTFYVQGFYYPLKNASVVINPGNVRVQMRNDDTGVYFVSGRFLPPANSYTATISAPGFQSTTRTFSFQDYPDQSFSIYLNADPSANFSPVTLANRMLVLDAPPWEGSIAFTGSGAYTLVTWFDYANGNAFSQRTGNEWYINLFAVGAFPGARVLLNFTAPNAGDFIFEKYISGERDEGTFTVR
jgi:hypothetical protein